MRSSTGAESTRRRWPRSGPAILLSALVLSLAGASPALASPSPHRLDAVVLARPGQLAAAEQAVRSAGGRVDAVMPLVSELEAVVPSGSMAQLESDLSVSSVVTDSSLDLQSDSTAAYDPTSDPHSLYNLETETGVKGLWSQTTGQGVGVAIIDSGVTPVLGLGQVVQGPDFTPSGRFDGWAHSDQFGHGTFMAGVIAGHEPGDDPTAPDPQSFLGVAPDATLVSVKVAGASGSTSMSRVVQGINWVIANAQTYNIKVLNLSIGAPTASSYTVDPLAFAVEQAWKAGIVVVAAAGNKGPGSGTLSAPAYDPYVVAVGAADLNQNGTTLAPFSSFGDGVRNPDVVAPGAHLQSLFAPNSYIAQQFSSSGQISGRYFRGSGTSEAAAFTSGVAALLVQEYPQATPDQIKALLVSTAAPLAGVPATGQGAGLIQPGSAAGPQSAATQAALAAPQTFPPAADPNAQPPVTANNPGQSSQTDTEGNSWRATCSYGGSGQGRYWSLRCAGGPSPSGNSWSGNSWSGNSWSGNSWSGNSWSGNSWSGNSWSGNSWSGNSWAGNSWAGNSWAGNSWG